MRHNVINAFLSSVDIFFFKINAFNEYFTVAPLVSNSLDPDQARDLIRPDLGTSCLKRLQQI